MEKCITLKDKIETLIRRGYLSKYKKEYRAEKPPKQEQTKNKPLVQQLNKLTNGVINIIVGG